MKKISLECDCGCGAIATGIEEYAGWLTLSQIQLVSKNSSDPKIIDGVVHLATFECLQKWVTFANEVIPKLKESASGVSPRGRFSNKKLRGIYI